MQVSARLYLREPIAKLGIAPLTSMFAFGENQPGRDDFRPEVHDSDGLLIAGGDRRMDLAAAGQSEAASGHLVRDDQPAGLRPDAARSLARELRGSGGAATNAGRAPGSSRAGPGAAGRVELVQLPTPDETNDNIVAYWVPDAPPAPGQPFDFAYRMRWQMSGTLPPGKAWVVQTRRGRGFTKRPDGDLNFVVDFDGPPLRGLAADAALEAVVWADANAEIHERNLFRNSVNGTWRMTVRFKRLDAAKAVELRAYLKQEQATLSETWSYIVPAEPEKP